MVSGSIVLSDDLAGAASVLNWAVPVTITYSRGSPPAESLAATCWARAGLAKNMVAMVSARLADEFLRRLEIIAAIEHPLVDQNPTG